jgi:hypothetical protein
MTTILNYTVRRVGGQATNGAASWELHVGLSGDHKVYVPRVVGERVKTALSRVQQELELESLDAAFPTIGVEIGTLGDGNMYPVLRWRIDDGRPPRWVDGPTGGIEYRLELAALEATEEANRHDDIARDDPIH